MWIKTSLFFIWFLLDLMFKTLYFLHGFLPFAAGQLKAEGVPMAVPGLFGARAHMGPLGPMGDVKAPGPPKAIPAQHYEGFWLCMPKPL